jgi:hypothetical protein
MAAERIAQVQEQRLGVGPGAAAMRTVVAFHEAWVGRARERCVGLAVAALDDGLLLRSSDVLGLNALLALICAEELQTATRFIGEALAAARRRGDFVNANCLLLFSGCVAVQRGDLRAAEEDLRGSEPGDAPSPSLWRFGYLADVLVDRGDLPAAARTLGSIQLDERVTMTSGFPGSTFPASTAGHGSTWRRDGWSRPLPASARSGTCWRATASATRRFFPGAPRPR